MSSFKHNTDRSIQRERYGYGGIIRDSKDILIQAYYIILHQCYVLYVELYAILHGLNVASNLSFIKLWIEVDALLVINILHKGFSLLPNVFYLVKRISALLKIFEYKISHIFREGNKCVDWLANNGAYLLNIMNYDNNFYPSKLRGFVKMDLLVSPISEKFNLWIYWALRIWVGCAFY